jgi:hypothetical protein
MTPVSHDNALTEDSSFHLAAASSSMVLTLAYFSLFKHPLREEEILTYTHFYAISREEGQAAIRSLLEQGILESHEGMLCLRRDAPLVAIRAEREARAIQWQSRVKWSIRVLSHLPFLRGLSVSGSLSKGTQDVDGDIDFFLLTAPNRLWTARFFAALMVKLLPKSKKINFCLNYCLPEDRLSIPDRSLFSATEVAFLKPVLNPDLFCAFFELNQWVKTYYPNWESPTDAVPDLRYSVLQRIAEWPLSGALGDWVETRISRWFIQRLNWRMSALPRGRCATDVRLGAEVFKVHTKGNHGKTHQGWEERVKQLEADLGLRVTKWPWAEAWTSWKPVNRVLEFPGWSNRSSPAGRIPVGQRP